MYKENNIIDTRLVQKQSCYGYTYGVRIGFSQKIN